MKIFFSQFSVGLYLFRQVMLVITEFHFIRSPPVWILHLIIHLEARFKPRHWSTGLFEKIVGVLTTSHTQYTWYRSICFLSFNRTTLLVTHLTGTLYVHPLWFYKHQHDNRVRSKLFVACQRWWFQWPFWFVSSVQGYLREEEEHKPDPWRNPIERNHMGLHLKNEVTSC